MMHWCKLVCVVALAWAITACDGGSDTPVDAGNVEPPDAALVGIAPVLTSFVATPNAATPGSPTMITWTWTYAGVPNPEPTCLIDNNVGVVTNGQMTSVTITAVTTFILTCTNSAGTATRQVVVGTGPPVAPNIATFTATPSSVVTGTATDVTWAWTYSGFPNPTPTCSISPTVGAVTNGQTTSITLTTSTTFTLTCTSVAGTRSANVFVQVISAPVAPSIATFTANPSTVTMGATTNVQFSWTYTTAPAPTPTCSIDQGLGTVTNGTVRSINQSAATTYTLTCTNASGTDTETVTINVTAPVAPVLSTFTATPSSIPLNTATAVTFNFSYGNVPSPAPTCAIDQGVGAITNGASRSLTQATDVTYTLTCMNGGGTSSLQTTVTVSVPPVIATFTATPNALTVANPTTVTWSWTYANSPLPAPTCSIEHGVGQLTPGATRTVTLSSARTYRLTCSNGGGRTTADVTLTVNECVAGTATCDANATCTDTPESYTCTCDTGYTGTGETCSQLLACTTTPTLCDPNATCATTASGPACVCNTGYVGDGASCQPLRIAFTTSATGTGNLSTWTDAGGMTGLAAGDAICNARATAAGLPGSYVAWLSDATNDAYCRVHGLTGTKASNCGQLSLPVAAGPWVRPDGRPFAPSIDQMLSPTLAMYYPGALTEAGVAIGATARVYTGTTIEGRAQTGSCTNWTSTSGTTIFGEGHGGSTAWTQFGSSQFCSTAAHLRCLQTTAGPALPPRHPLAKKAFVTSVTGSGVMSTWADANGLTGLDAADAVCQARARFAGYLNPQRFKAWLSSPTTAATRITTNGPWVRPDGIYVALTEVDLEDSLLMAAMFVSELGSYVSGELLLGHVWTGSFASGSSSSSTCSSWTSSTSSGRYGHYNLADSRWSYDSTSTCSALKRIYCLED